MTNIVYGVDMDKEVTPVMVRDAIIQCFGLAHCIDAGLPNASDEASKSYCRELVEKGFKETGGDFNAPTKASLKAVTNFLAEYSKKFRNPELIRQHYGEIGALINKLSG